MDLGLRMRNRRGLNWIWDSIRLRDREGKGDEFGWFRVIALRIGKSKSRSKRSEEEVGVRFS